MRGWRCVRPGRAICGEGAWGRSGVQTSRRGGYYRPIPAAHVQTRGHRVLSCMCALQTSLRLAHTGPRRHHARKAPSRGSPATRRSSAPLLGSQGLHPGRAEDARGELVRACSATESAVAFARGRKSRDNWVSFTTPNGRVSYKFEPCIVLTTGTQQLMTRVFPRPRPASRVVGRRRGRDGFRGDGAELRGGS